MSARAARAARIQAHPLYRLWRYAAPHRARLVWATVLTVLNKTFDVFPEILIGVAIDVIVQGDDSFVADLTGIDGRWGQLLVLAAANGVVWIGESASEWGYQLLWRNLAQTIEHEARMDAYAHVQRLEMGYFEDQSTGGLMSVLNDDVNQLERFLDVGATAIILTVVNVVLVGAVFLVADPLLFLIAFAPIPVIVWGSFLYQRKLEPRYADVRAKVGHLNGTLSNNLGGIATIKAFTAEEREIERVRAESDAYRIANGNAIRLSSAFVPLIRIAILIGFTMTLLVGGRMVIDETLAVGFFSVLVFMTQRLLWPLTRLGETFDLYQRAMASTRRILDLLAVRPTITEGERRLRAPVAGAVRFDEVRFSYAGGPEVLRGLDIDIAAGETHAVVGLTGAGKSTIVKLLLRLYEPSAGRVTVDGVDVRELTFADLRGAIGLVSQDVFLFDGTVRENIAYGDPDAPLERVEEAARLAEAHEFITRLPQGYDTMVGERGQKLSGGQRQRLSIARAIVRDPAILVLDEATSSVDNETEAAIQRSLETVSRDRTTLMIAHRLSTVRHADRIHVLEAGQVREAGTHDELVAAGGLYAALWRVQTGEGARVG
ncbi:ABC transporter ATP-binding protein [Miltoncostaea marina]|uniref:ABC transporter ATP-binding protein n=1 Tax=Miltoncostaea marina TaxID=2843215 RepID=UPI001C3E5932|nr:ABC transporter ATP-binding protein [Miltoncostaea marina]